MATPLDAIKEVAEQNLGFYAFCFADEIAASDVQEVAQWADDNDRIFLHTSTDIDEAVVTKNALEAANIGHTHVMYSHDYTGATGGFAGVALDQQYGRTDGVKTVHLKAIRGLDPSDITQTQANEMIAAGVTFYSGFGNSESSVSAIYGGKLSDNRYLDFVMGIDWLRNTIEVSVFNGQRIRRTTPQTSRGMMMTKNDIVMGLEQAVRAGLIAPGQWNGIPVGEVQTYDYLPNGYYVYHDPIDEQSQVDRDNRLATQFTVIAKGAGSIHGADITLVPQA
ncbi:DUF3383 family protein [Psychrobacter sp. AOP7-A1-24]|uniref:DUF3383 family protein n=1 Tax=Psychrobacter sp. AOP7-A1-24 TaxID=3457646 RepID=UPI00402B1A54